MKQTNRLILLLALIKFVLPFLLQSNYYEPHRDEFLYLSEGQHMAWGYMEVPPLLSVFAWLTNVFGGGMFWIKFWPSLFGALTFVITARTVVSLGGKTFALLLAFLPFVLGVYLRLQFLFQPNFLEVFFWTLIAYSVVRYIQTSQNKWLYLLGISIGLGMLSKYSVAFFAVSILLGLLFTKQRKIFTNKHLYFAGLIALLIFLPTVLWEYNHHFPVITHMRELEQTQLQYVSPVGFLFDQLLMNLPCVFIWLAGLYFVGISYKGKPYRTFALAYVFVIVLLLIFKGKNYYSLGVYPVLFAFGAYHLEQFTQTRSIIWRYAFVLIPLLIGIPFIPLALPVAKPQVLASYYKTIGAEKSGLLKWEDLQNHPLPQDFADMLSWKETTQKVAKAYAQLSDEEKKQTIIFCDNYGLAGAVDFYRRKYQLPEPYSDNGSFLYWIPQPLHVTNVIVVTPDTQEMQHDFVKEFRSAQVIDSITNPYAREKGSLIILFKGASEKFNQYLQQQLDRKLAKLKNHASSSE
jgi:4-amino-4-deoxy-L-arabinose transferase-like glycosyltransferase